MGFTVEYIDAELTQKSVFGKVAHLPFLMDSYSHYHDRGSEYLIDRGLGHWNPETGFRGRRRRPPGPKSIENYASWLANFLHWAEAGNRDPLEMDYWEDLYEDYHGDMQSGAWSRHGKPLKPNTFNPRVDTACDYLRWLSAKGFRDEFYVPTEMRKVPSHGSEGSGSKRKKEVEVRQGKVPATLTA